MIAIGTKVIVHSVYGDCNCYCGQYNEEDRTYEIYNGCNASCVSKKLVEKVEW